LFTPTDGRQNWSVNIAPEDLRIDVFREIGGTSRSAVRITYLPTGVSVEVDSEATMRANRTKAMELLKERIDGVG
jgi:protein subunit release factor A